MESVPGVATIALPELRAGLQESPRNREILANRRMIAGCDMAAYATECGAGGVMTFIVSHNGKVYERNVGKDSAAVGAKMTTFDFAPGRNRIAR